MTTSATHALWRHLALGMVMLASIACDAVAQPAACPQFFLRGTAPAFLNVKLGQRVTVLCNEAYAVAASGVTHGALWSAEHLTAAGVAVARDTPRAASLHPDDRLPPSDQAQIADYRESGYDRGHMTPSGDMPSPSAQAESFSLANVVPQNGALNRGAWEGIETAVRALAAEEGELYLVTGPAFVGRTIQAIGPNGVLVPTATWKAVYDARTGGAGVYVCQNTARPRCAVVSVDQLARTVGIDPFPALPQRVKTVAMLLPEPGENPYAARGQRYRPLEPPGMLERLFGWMKAR